MFASLPNLADKNFVIGFLLPVLTAGMAGVFLFRDTAWVQAMQTALFQAQTLSDLTIVVIGVWGASVLLLVFNHHIHRLLEGYEGPFNYWPRWKRRQRCRFEQTLKRLLADYKIVHRNDGAEVSEGVMSDYRRRWRIRNETFPDEADHVLPTRFGNVIRAFESYPYKVYGIDSIPGWPRLQAVISKEFSSTIDDARAQVDFFVNVLTLSLLIAGAAMVRLAVNGYILQYCAHDDFFAYTYCIRHDWSDEGFRWEFCVWIVLSLAVARVCYGLAIGRAIAWGSLVKSAFDLCLPKLAAELGYTLPDTNDKRKGFWDAVNSQLLYNTPIPDEWSRASPEREVQSADELRHTADPGG